VQKKLKIFLSSLRLRELCTGGERMQDCKRFLCASYNWQQCGLQSENSEWWTMLRFQQAVIGLSVRTTPLPSSRFPQCKSSSRMPGETYGWSTHVGVWMWDHLYCDHLSGGDFICEEKEKNEKEKEWWGRRSCSRSPPWSLDDRFGWSFGRLKKNAILQFCNFGRDKIGADCETVKIPTAPEFKTKYHNHCESIKYHNHCEMATNEPETLSFKSHQYCSLSFVFRLHINVIHAI